MKINKIFSRIIRKYIFLWDGVSTKKYMKKYTKWLKKQKMNIQGTPKYISHTVFFDGYNYSKIFLGNHVVISLNCILLVHDCSLEAGLATIGKQSSQEAFFSKDIIIGDDCFIGANVTILAGTQIGNNCIVGAGSVIPGKKFPNNCIIAGNPARVIGNTKEWAQKKYDENEFIRGFF